MLWVVNMLFSRTCVVVCVVYVILLVDAKGNDASRASEINTVQELMAGTHSADPSVRGLAYKRLLARAPVAKTKTEQGSLLESTMRALDDECADIRESIAWRLSMQGLETFSVQAVEHADKYVRAQREMTIGAILLWGALNLECRREQVVDLARRWPAAESRYREEGRDVRGSVVNSREWAAVLAQARRGDSNSVARVLSLVDSPKLTEQDRAQLFEYAAFIRRPEAVELLRKYVSSDLSTGAPEHGGELADYAAPLWLYAAMGLAVCLDDFPIAGTRPGDFVDHKDRIREFMNEHRGAWCIKGQINPPVATPVPGVIAPAKTVSPGQMAPSADGVDTNSVKTGVSRKAPALASSEHGSRTRAVAGVACGIAALGGVGLLIWRRRSAGSSARRAR